MEIYIPFSGWYRVIGKHSGGVTVEKCAGDNAGFRFTITTSDFETFVEATQARG